MEYYLGIDIGTSAAKITVIDCNGAMISCCEQEYQYAQPQPGWKEILPQVWVDAVKNGLHEILGDIDRSAVKAIGFSGQMHTTVFLDRQGGCIRPAIMWNDIRTKEYFPELRKGLTQPDTAAIARIISTGSPAANLLWLKQHEPDHFDKLGKFLIGHDYLVYYFTGCCSTDYCQASTSSLYDTAARQWSVTMKELIGLPDEVYPPLKGSLEVVGSLRPEIQREFGLSPEIKVIAGTGDNSAAAVSTGSLQFGYPVLSIGTSGVLVVPGEKHSPEAKGKEILFSLDGREVTSLTQGVVQSAGGSYGWFIRKILGSRDFSSVPGAVDPEVLGTRQLLFYPHLNGDKTIYGDSSLRGAFVGLDINDSRDDMAIAVMEGVCFAVKQLIEAMELTLDSLEQLMVTGGGANSPVWMQILADILNLRIAQLDFNEGASYGAAVLAGQAVHPEQQPGAAVKPVRPRRYFEPRPYNAALYAEKYRQYLRLHDAVKRVYQQ